ncbi:MAG: DUF427 domain-containing protein [Alphaproteobacteria bacterium]|nr:DUF427 domain-containing protein [Alphaproteobacteria bacterium]
MKEPGPDHPITIEPSDSTVTVTYNGRTIARSGNALRLRETTLAPVLYIPQSDVDMASLEPTDHATYCPYKGDASYWTVTVDGQRAENAVWAYAEPYPAVTAIKGHLAFYSDRVEVVEDGGG